MQQSNPKKNIRRPQHQNRPGLESKMKPLPVFDYPGKAGNGKLAGKTALITGGDSGIRRAVAVLFAKEGADVIIIYLQDDKQIRVNAVAPGPIWTPLIASSFQASKVAKHGSDAPIQRVGEPAEVAPAYLFLASDDASYISGQVIHPNGGEIVNR